MKENIPDAYAPSGRPFQPKVVTGAQVDYMRPIDNAPTTIPEPSDVECVAGWIAQLRYGDMKTVAAGILGDDAKPEDVAALADKIHVWAEKAKLR